LPADLQQRQRQPKSGTFSAPGSCRFWRPAIAYAHITTLRGDRVQSANPWHGARSVSEDALRRALARMSADESRDWLQPQLLASVQAALSTSWILDIDSDHQDTVRQAERRGGNYNPHKPGRPSHALHTYFVSGFAFGFLDVAVSPGKEHTAAPRAPRT